MKPLDLGFRRRDDEDLVGMRDRVELVAHAADVAAEPLDRFERQMAMHARRAGLNFCRRGDRKTAALGQNRRDRMKVRWLLRSRNR